MQSPLQTRHTFFQMGTVIYRSYHIVLGFRKIFFFFALYGILIRAEQNSWKELPPNKANGNQKSLGHLKGAKTIAQ